MALRIHGVLLLIGLVMGASCLPAPPLGYQVAPEEVDDEEEEQAGEKQVETGAATLLSVASMIPQVVRPLLNNISTGLTNALTATVMGRAIAFIPPETASPGRQVSPPVGS